MLGQFLLWAEEEQEVGQEGVEEEEEVEKEQKGNKVDRVGERETRKCEDSLTL